MNNLSFVNKEPETMAESFLRYTKENIQQISHNFFVIGFRLNEAENQGYVSALGYKNIYELAENEFGFKSTTTKNLMQINRRFSAYEKNNNILTCKYSMHIDEDYKDFTKEQLTELASVKWAYGSVTPDMTCKEIRAYKKCFDESGNKIEICKDTHSAKEMARTYLKYKDEEEKAEQLKIEIPKTETEYFQEITFDRAEELLKKANLDEEPESLREVVEEPQEIYMQDIEEDENPELTYCLDKDGDRVDRAGNKLIEINGVPTKENEVKEIISSYVKHNQLIWNIEHEVFSAFSIKNMCGIGIPNRIDLKEKACDCLKSVIDKVITQDLLDKIKRKKTDLITPAIIEELRNTNFYLLWADDKIKKAYIAPELTKIVQPKTNKALELNNKTSRENFLKDYIKWEQINEVKELDLKIYKYTFLNGAKIIASEYYSSNYYSKKPIKEVRYCLILTDELNDEYYKNTSVNYYYKNYSLQGTGKTEIIDYMTKLRGKI